MTDTELDLEELKDKLTYCVLNSLRTESDPSDDRLKEIIAEIVNDDSLNLSVPLDQKREIALTIFNSLRRLDVIEPLMEDSEVTEIMVNGPYDIFY